MRYLDVEVEIKITPVHASPSSKDGKIKNRKAKTITVKKLLLAK